MTLRKSAAILSVCAAALASLPLASCRRSSEFGPSAAEARLGKLEAWTVADGYLESRDVRQIASQLNGPAAIVEVVPDGASVNAGDVVARFDSAQLERETLRLDRDYTLAREDLSSLVNAKLPLEIRDMELRLSDARARQADEVQALEDTRELAKDGLIPEKDIQQQEARIESARAQADSFEQQLDLTRKHIHPSLLARSKATFASAEQELDLARRQLSNCVVRAPAPGIVSYKPFPTGSEFRTVRVGDTIYVKQPFMTVSDMSNLVMCCDVYEAEIMRFKPGCPAWVAPMALPDLTLKGAVESIASTARTLPGRASGQKFFSVVIRLEETDPRLRAGMSAQARALSYSNEEALLIPRAAVVWEGGVPWCRIKEMFGVRKARLTLGMADENNYEVLDGVKSGQRVELR